jgi:hypothetical protein
MRKVRAILGVALLVAVAAVPVAAGSSSPFEGSWTSIDPVDDSTQHLTVRGSAGHAQVEYVDEFGTTCLNIGAPTMVFTGVLTASISGDEMVAVFKSAGCGPRIVLRAADGFAWFFEYDPTTDTLFGAINDGPATWYRD